MLHSAALVVELLIGMSEPRPCALASMMKLEMVRTCSSCDKRSCHGMFSWDVYRSQYWDALE
jgi:hypothetical protein